MTSFRLKKVTSPYGCYLRIAPNERFDDAFHTNLGSATFMEVDHEVLPIGMALEPHESHPLTFSVSTQQLEILEHLLRSRPAKEGSLADRVKHLYRLRYALSATKEEWASLLSSVSQNEIKVINTAQLSLIAPLLKGVAEILDKEEE